MSKAHDERTGPTVAGLETTTARAPEIGGESAFGMNAKPERGAAIAEYRHLPHNLPNVIGQKEIARDAMDYCPIRTGGGQ